jgi:cardiolipin synthase
MLGAAFPAVAPVSEPVGWAITLWGAFLYWWAGVIYAIETARVIRIPRVAGDSRSDTLEEGG